MLYPPFTKLIRIILSFKSKDSAKQIIKGVANKVKKITTPLSGGGKAGGIELLGPAPAPIEKIRNLWRWHLVLKGKNSKNIRQTASNIYDALKDIKDVKIDIDVDPINLL